MSAELGARIQRLRKARDISLSDLARQTGVSRGYLYLLENGENNPTHSKLQLIANAFGVLIGELLGEMDSIEDLEVTDTLKQFARTHKLSSADVMVLSKINYRGRYAETETEFGILHSVIKGTLGGKS